MVYTAVSWFKKTVTAVSWNITAVTFGIGETVTGVSRDKETVTADTRNILQYLGIKKNAYWSSLG